MTWPDEVLEWLSSIGKRDALKVVLGLYSIFGNNKAGELVVKPDLIIPDELLKRIQIRDNHTFFIDEEARNEFEKIVMQSIVKR